MRNIVKIAGLIAVSAGGWLPMAGLGAEPPRIPIDRVVAHVNEHLVTLGEIKSMILPRMPALHRQYRGADLEEKLDELYRQALDHLIERRLILDAYEKQEGRIPEWVVDQHVDEVIRHDFDGDRGALIRTLAQEGISLADWREDLRKSMIVSSMQGAAVGERVHVSPAEIRSYYARHRDQFRENDRVQSLAEAQPQIEAALRSEKTERRHREWIARLRENAYVRVLEPR